MSTVKAPKIKSALVSKDETMLARSLVIPVYKNAENIDDLITAVESLNKVTGGLEVVFVIDGSPDDSGLLLMQMRERFSFAYQIIFHSRNFGSFTAIRTGLSHARGKTIAVMAADLQEPPELVIKLFKVLESNKADVVFGKREHRDDGAWNDVASNLFWWAYRKLVMKDMPKGGVDIFACTQKVAQAVLSICEPNSSLIAQLFWVGYRREFVGYTRKARQKGSSGWSFMRRLWYMVDSIVSFTDFPIMMVLWLGILGCVTSFTFGGVVLVARVLGMIDVAGYTGIVVLVSFSVSLLLAVQGVLGLYLWRTFENTKSRPLGLVSHIVKK